MLLRLTACSRRLRFDTALSLCRYDRRGVSSWAHSVSQPSNAVQCYTSTTRDPHLNLSIEHFFHKNSHPSSVILFQYINRPSIVIGRNQNPWLEVNLPALEAAEHGSLGTVSLVRRRSGGGAVFHDQGNVNWTVICPAASFNRDKHAEMVVRALRGSGVERARVNDRHDIVLDQGIDRKDADAGDMHITPFTNTEEKPLKVSGSAYKLTKGRALHHATCLLQSPNLANISQLLRSPARAFIRAKGVESVSSPVTNIGLDTIWFREAVRKEFASMYGADDLRCIEVGDDAMDVPDIVKGYEELRTPEWLWDQTPHFTLSSQPKEGFGNAVHPESFQLDMEFRHAQYLRGSLQVRSDETGSLEEVCDFEDVMRNLRLRDAWTWRDVLVELGLVQASRVEEILGWLEGVIPSKR